MKLFNNFKKALFESRLNRFVVRCRLGNSQVLAYLPNPGRLRELLLPGSILYVAEQPPSAKYPFMAVAVDKEGAPVLLHTHMNNAIARHLIEQKQVPGLEDYKVLRPEVTIGNSRFDFLLSRGKKEIVLEVKSCTQFSGPTGMFPDAPTLRGKRHIEELRSLPGRNRRGAVLFIVHSPKVRYFLPDYHTDLPFSRALLSSASRIIVKAVSVGIHNDLSLKNTARELFIPWNLVRQEAVDRGSYILILHVKRSKAIEPGSPVKIRFRSGYYLYIGAARENLSKHMARHQRDRKNLLWDIDYLIKQADVCAALPVRSSADLQCDIASAIQNISEWAIPGFGSSECSCRSHLYALSGNPLHSPDFIKILMYFRMERLEGES